MKPVRIFCHVQGEGPGYLLDILAQRQIPVEQVNIYAGEPVATGLDDISALVFMGGNMSVNDPLPWIDEELTLVRRAADLKLPILGICLGCQLIVRALGGVVSPGGKGMELGWHPVQQRAPDSPWLQGLPDKFDVFHWHGETFSLPEGAQLLTGNDCFEHQAYALGKILGIQFHIEMKTGMVQDWASRFTDDIANGGDCGQSAEDMLADLAHRIDELNQVAEVMLGHWINQFAE
ncbi:MAG: GMP synthase [Gammaproteobacteria bacterium]|nr:MAG: GMP synthase [Gammaproteobacteria bacterium]